MRSSKWGKEWEKGRGKATGKICHTHIVKFKTVSLFISIWTCAEACFPAEAIDFFFFFGWYVIHDVTTLLSIIDGVTLQLLAFHLSC